MLQVDIHHQALFFLVARTIVEFALRTRHETAAPELDALGLTARIRLETNPVHRHHRQTVGHGMTTHHRGPRLTLALLLLLGVVGGIADGSRVDEDIRTLQCHQAGSLGIPLVPANQHAQLAHRSLDRVEAQVARGEVEFFVVGRIIRNMHLAVFSGDGSILLNHHRRVVIEARRTALEERCNDYHAQILRQFAVEFGRWSRDGFGKVEVLHILYLAEVERVVEFLQNDEFSATLSQVDDALGEARFVIGDIRRDV